MDRPDKRRNHLTPTSRLGGTSFLPVALLSLVFCHAVYSYSEKDEYYGFPPTMQAFGIGITLLYVMGLVDDLKGINFKIKLCIQVLAASIPAFSGLNFHYLLTEIGLTQFPYTLNLILTIFFIVYTTNAINFIDGIDGLAGGIGILTFLTYTIISLFCGEDALVFLCVSSLGILSAFLIFGIYGCPTNRKKIFMGDTGSQTLGFFISYIILALISASSPPLIPIDKLALIILSPILIPLFDVIHVVYVRLRKHSSIFLPDRQHIHHMLLNTGLSASSTLVVLLIISLCYILLNTLFLLILPFYATIAIDVIVWLLIIHYINNKSTK